MAMAWDTNLDPKIAELVNAAFDKSWQFVKTDPELAHGDPQEMRTRLGQNLARLAQNCERVLWGRQTAAMGNLRRERSAAWRAIDSRRRNLDIGGRSRRRPPPRGEPVGGTITPRASPPPGATAAWRVATKARTAATIAASAPAR